MAYFAIPQGRARVDVNVLDLTQRAGIASLNQVALAFPYEWGVMDPVFTTSAEDALERFTLDGKVSTRNGAGLQSLLVCHRTLRQAVSLRLTNQAKHSGVTVYADRERVLRKLRIRKHPDGFFSRKELDRYKPDPWSRDKGETYESLLLVFDGPLKAGAVITMRVVVSGVRESDGARIDGDEPISVTWNTDSDTTINDLAFAILNALSIYADGAEVEVVDPDDWYTDQTRQIRVWSPKQVAIALLDINITGGSNQPDFDIENTVLFDVFSLAPSALGNNLAVKVSNFSQGEPHQVRMTFNRALTVGNSFSCTVNDVAVGPVLFAVNSDTTMANIALAIQAAAGGQAYSLEVGGGNANDRQIQVVGMDANRDVVISGISITGGATQPSVIVTEMAPRVPPDGSFSVSVYNHTDMSNPAETWRVTLNDSLDGFGNSRNIEYVINSGPNRSNLIRVRQPDWSKDCSVAYYPDPDTAPVFLEGGSAGYAPTVTHFQRAWTTFSDRQRFPDIRIMISAGYTQPSVLKAIAGAAVARRDSIAILDVPSDKQRASDVVAFKRNELGVITSYATLNTPDLEVDDQYSGKRQFMPPSPYVAAVMGYTDENNATWWSPAGHKRANVSTQFGVLNARHAYSDGEQDSLSNNYINFFAKKQGSSIVLWNDDTLQNYRSDLSFVSVRRLVNMLEVIFRDTAEYELFDPNDEHLWFAIEQKLESVLKPIKQDRGLWDYRVACDRRTNKPEFIDAGIVSAYAMLKVVKPAKWIKIGIVLTKYGASFEETLLAIDAA